MKGLYRLYVIEVLTIRGRWQAKGDVRLAPGEPTIPTAERMAVLHGCDVRLVLKHPQPPDEYITRVHLDRMTRRGGQALRTKEMANEQGVSDGI